MRKQKNVCLWLGKTFLVSLMILSRLYAPIEVLAEELENNNTTAETIEKQPTEEETTKEDTTEEKTAEEETTKEDTTEEKTAEEETTKEDTTEEKTTEEETTKEDTTEEKATDSEETTKEDTTKDETTEEKSNIKVTINNKETTTYTLEEDETTAKVEILFNESTKEENIDFSKKLPGTYEYQYIVEDSQSNSETITVQIIKKSKNADIYYKYLLDKTKFIQNGEDEYAIVILGSQIGMSKENFMNVFDSKTFLEDYKATGTVNCGIETVISSSCQFTINVETEENESAKIEPVGFRVFGDYTKDGIVTPEDADKLLEKLITKDTSPLNEVDINNDGEFTILDATHHVFEDGTWEETPEQPELLDELNNSLTNKSTVNVSDEFTVKYNINGFDKNVMNGISGDINYNKELLELINIEFETAPISMKANIDDQFVILLDNYKTNGIFMTLTFKVLAEGEANISIDNIIAGTNGQKLSIGDSVSTTVTILNNGKGGDTEPEATDQEVPEEKSTPEVAPTPIPNVEVKKQNNVSTTGTVQRTALSSDKLIKSLTIEGYSIDFDPNKYEYAIKVKNSVTSLNLDIVLNSSSARYVVTGNENFKVGENTVNIVVTAEDESTQTYTIKVTREKAKTTEEEEDDDEEVEKKSSSKAIIIVLIILVIIGLIYVIFKDDEEDKKDNK